MRGFINVIAVCVAAVAAPVGAVSLSEDTVSRMSEADIVLLGEVHDNPDHHAAQAELVRVLAPRAIVFEMLTPDAADRVTPNLINDPARMEQVLNWADSGWPDFEMYHPIFLAHPDAAIVGAALPRSAARAAMKTGLAQAFGPEADLYGLTDPLPEQEQDQREALQFAAHCDALPRDMLPAMVDVQRLRDARLAQQALAALAETDGPVVIITGNGHARSDWGIPRYLRRVAPHLTLFALGQSEDGDILPGAFDAIIDAPAAERPDPCDAFRD